MSYKHNPPKWWKDYDEETAAYCVERERVFYEKFKPLTFKQLKPTPATQYSISWKIKEP